MNLFFIANFKHIPSFNTDEVLPYYQIDYLSYEIGNHL